MTLDEKIALALSLTGGADFSARAVKLGEKTTGYDPQKLKAGDDAVEVRFKLALDPKQTQHVVYGRAVVEAVDLMLAKVMEFADGEAATLEQWAKTNLETAETWKRLSTRVRLST